MFRTALSVALILCKMANVVSSAVDVKQIRSSSWCDVNVVTFDDGKQESVVEPGSKRVAEPGNGKLSLPPDTLAESKWARGIPSNEASIEPPTIDEIKSWHFDPLQYPAEALIPAFSTTMQYFDLPSKFNVSINTLDNFAAKVMERHNPQASYHNWHHGITTLHGAFALLTLGGADEFLTDLDIFAVLFAALIHDVDHAGNNNDFEVKTRTALAAKYANQSVLENNSIDVTYDEILTAEGCDIFEGMKESGREEDRLLVLQLAKDFVLATDAADHGDMLKKLASLKQEAGPHHDSVWNRDDAESRSMLCRMIIHSADIYNPVAPDFVVARDWCHRISQEFALQGAAERSLGLEVTAFMDGLTDEYKIAKQQQGFYTWMALPLFAVVGSMLPRAKVLEAWGKQNLQHFTDIISVVDEWKDKPPETVL